MLLTIRIVQRQAKVDRFLSKMHFLTSPSLHQRHELFINNLFRNLSDQFFANMEFIKIMELRPLSKAFFDKS